MIWLPELWFSQNLLKAVVSWSRWWHMLQSQKTQAWIPILPPTKGMEARASRALGHNFKWSLRLELKLSAENSKRLGRKDKQGSCHASQGGSFGASPPMWQLILNDVKWLVSAFRQVWAFLFPHCHCFPAHILTVSAQPLKVLGFAFTA